MLRLKNLTASPGGVDVLKKLNFTLKAGEKVHVSGPSGSGKSTLLRAMLFFENFGGEVLFEGVRINGNSVPEYRSRIAFLGQHLPPYAGTAEQVLWLPFGYRGNRSLRPERKRVLSFLREFRLEEDVLMRPFSALSGGQQQRLMLIQVLLLDRPLIVLDEPTGGLDPANRKRVVKYLCGRKDITLVAVSHDPEWSEAAVRCLQMSGGRLVKGRCST